MSRTALALLVGLAALGPSACRGGAPLLRDEAVVVGSSPFTLEVIGEGKTLLLRRGHDVLVTLPADAFQLGIAAEPSEGRSWDPWDLERRGEAESGVEFRAPRAFSSALEPAPAGAPAAGARGQLHLDYGDGFGADLIVDDQGEGAFRLVMIPREPPGIDGPRTVMMRVRVRTSGDPKEGFYGLGEWEDSVDNRGKLRPMQLEADLEIEAGSTDNHVPVPFLIGTRGWAMFVASDRVGVFDVARKDPEVVEATFAVASIEGDSPAPLPIWLFGGDRPLDLVKACYRVGGEAKLPAPWAYGPWIWRDENRDQAEVQADIATIRSLDLPTSGIWVDRPYARAVNTFDFDAARFPDPGAMIGEAHRQGLAFALWSTPYLEPSASPLRAEAELLRYFPLASGLPLNKWSSPIDFTNPDAFTFWSGLVRRYVALGVDGFKLDYGEDVVPSIGERRNVWRFVAGDERTMHFHYSDLYHLAYARTSDRPDAGFLLCRAAHFGEQTTGCVIWPGDIDATFTRHRERFRARDGSEVVGVGGLPAAVVMGLSLGVSGFPFFGADTGGYRHSPPDEELFVRWTQQSALSSVMQVGDSSSQPPWVFTPENGRSAATVDLYRTYARLHTRLFPYAWTHAVAIARTGHPLQQPLGLAFPELGIHPSDAYLFGDDLLVAPVISRGERRREVVAPAGAWIDWWDATPYDSDGLHPLAIDAPLEKLPLLMRDGAIVPMLRPTIDTLAPADDPAVDSFARDAGLLHARIAPGRPRAFTLWDGSRIERAADGSLVVSSGTVFTRGFVLELVGTPEPSELTRDGILPRKPSTSALDLGDEGWTWSPSARGTLTIKLPPTARVRLR